MNRSSARALAVFMASLVIVLTSVACGDDDDTREADAQRRARRASLASTVPPSSADGMMAASDGTETTSTREGALSEFPCAKCHESVIEHPGTANTGRHRQVKPDHMPEMFRCDLCHDYSDLDGLVLLTGAKLKISNSVPLCAQCHFDKAKDWRLGIHGRTVGSWQSDGPRHRLLCVECHDPHAPRRLPMMALPPPPRPALGIAKGDHHD